GWPADFGAQRAGRHGARSADGAAGGECRCGERCRERGGCSDGHAFGSQRLDWGREEEESIST
ncbi:unnamed protein product, partial [Durusdinium trenchii]